MSRESEKSVEPLIIAAVTTRRDDTTLELATRAVSSGDFVEVDGALDVRDSKTAKPDTLPLVIVAGRTGVDETAVVKPLTQHEADAPRFRRWWIVSGVCVAASLIAIVIATRSKPSESAPTPTPSPEIEQPIEPIDQSIVRAKPPIDPPKPAPVASAELPAPTNLAPKVTKPAATEPKAPELKAAEQKLPKAAEGKSPKAVEPKPAEPKPAEPKWDPDSLFLEPPP